MKEHITPLVDDVQYDGLGGIYQTLLTWGYAAYRKNKNAGWVFYLAVFLIFSFKSISFLRFTQ